MKKHMMMILPALLGLLLVGCASNGYDNGTYDPGTSTRPGMDSSSPVDRSGGGTSPGALDRTGPANATDGSGTGGAGTR